LDELPSGRVLYCRVSFEKLQMGINTKRASDPPETMKIKRYLWNKLTKMN
jgi:hypothetical protein